LCGKFPIPSRQEKEQALLSMFINFDLKYAMRRFEETQRGQEFSGTHQLLSEQIML
jgi:hypothetical protein